MLLTKYINALNGLALSFKSRIRIFTEEFFFFRPVPSVESIAWYFLSVKVLLSKIY